MEKANGRKDKGTEKYMSYIKEERLKKLKENYQRPELSGFDFNENERFEGDDLTVAYMCTSGC